MKQLQSTILGFPRMGENRELKRALESFWQQKSSEQALLETAKKLRIKHWQKQIDAGIDVIPVNDFSLYDTVLDTSFAFGVIPKRYTHLDNKSVLRRYFAMARGEKGDANSVTAMEMSKWFDTNYHYIVPEFSKDTQFTDFTDSDIELKVLQEIEEAKQCIDVVHGKTMEHIRPVLIGPMTYLLSGKSTDESNPLDLLPAFVKSYIQLLLKIAETGVTWVQLDEPMLATDLDEKTKALYVTTYESIAQNVPNLKIFLAIYFDDLYENAQLVSHLPVSTVHLDLIRGNTKTLESIAKEGKQISLGLVDGRNIWKSNIQEKLETVKFLCENFKQNSQPWFISSSCSLLHSPMDVSSEIKLQKAYKGNIGQWFSFAVQKLREIALISIVYNDGLEDSAICDEIQHNTDDLVSRTTSFLVHKDEVKKRVQSVTSDMAKRNNAFLLRKKTQDKEFELPLFPTTTIGSFPQTAEIRKMRVAYKEGKISEDQYTAAMKTHIREVVNFQEKIGIDVFVHGEPERNDMVEYFGEKFDGFITTENGWVQSYGSRCVKPPIIYGDLTRKSAITVDWISYAQSITKRSMKAMLTGPITILQWSFVRDDQARQDTAMQIALVIRDEVLDLENANIKIIQVDEPAIREGLPLRKRNHEKYLDWAVKSFKISTCCVKDSTQIHTHMCYSEFNEIIESIAALDTDVISIEASRSRMDLLQAFRNFKYPSNIGPGVYDIHSPRVPSTQEMVTLLEAALKYIPKEQLWVNPDCGLKTRAWEEVKPSLLNMVEAAKILRRRNF